MTSRFEVHALAPDHTWVIVEPDAKDGELTEHTAHRLAESLVETRTHPATRVVLVGGAS